MYKLIIILIIIISSSCNKNNIEVVMRGRFGGFEEWKYGEEYILAEPKSQLVAIPDTLVCCDNTFILYGKFIGSKEYEINYEFVVNRRIYVYDSFYIKKPFISSWYDEEKKKTIYKKYSKEE